MRADYGANSDRTTASPRRCAVTASVVFGVFASTACSSVSRGRMRRRRSDAASRV
jgi:hypothetical protein